MPKYNAINRQGSDTPEDRQFVQQSINFSMRARGAVSRAAEAKQVSVSSIYDTALLVMADLSDQEQVEVMRSMGRLTEDEAEAVRAHLAAPTAPPIGRTYRAQNPRASYRIINRSQADVPDEERYVLQSVLFSSLARRRATEAAKHLWVSVASWIDAALLFFTSYDDAEQVRMMRAKGKLTEDEAAQVQAILAATRDAPAGVPA